MKPTRNLWPYGLITAFVLFFAGMATVVTIAVTHQENLVSDQYYENELNFQGQLDSAARAQKAGADIRYDASARSVVIALPPGQVAGKLAGTIQLYRADAPEKDRTLTLQPGSDGRQTLNVAQFATGPWLLRVNWQAAGQGYYLEQKFIIPAS
jgi:hypothetical protein